MVIMINLREAYMKLNYKRKKQPKKLKRLITVLSSLICLIAFETVAEPYLSIKTQQACSTCHVNPTGGGMRTTYGNSYGYSQLPSSSSEINHFDFAKIGDFIKFGGNFRYDFTTSDNDTAEKRQAGFGVESAQIYTLIKAGREDLSIYIDQQVAPGGALNREAFVIKKFGSDQYLKVGKMMPTLGLKIEDDSAFIRQVTGFNFDNSDNGIEYGLVTSRAFYNFYITNGTNAVTNDDNKFQLGSRAEFYFDEFRVGGAAVFNDGDEVDRRIFSLFAGYHWEQFTLMGEVDSISLQSQLDSSQDLTEIVGLVELNYDLMQGHNLKLTSEYHDPDNDLDEDHQVRNSIIYEYTPYSNIQLRFGFRLQEAPPQNLRQNSDKVFIQTHFYF